MKRVQSASLFVLLFFLSQSLIAQTFTFGLASFGTDMVLVQAKVEGAAIIGANGADICPLGDPMVDLLGGLTFGLVWEAATGITNVTAVAEDACNDGYNIVDGTGVETAMDGRMVKSYTESGSPFHHPYDWTDGVWVTICTLNISMSTPGDNPLESNGLNIIDSTDPLLIEFPGHAPSIFTSVNGDALNPADYVPETEQNDLPLTLLSFQAKRDGERSALLEWETASEINTSHFVIQRSEDATNWTDIGAVDAAGQSNEVRSYSFMDRNVYDGKKPSARFYYRLAMIDQDASSAYSTVEAVKFSSVTAGNTVIFVYPNPSTVGLNIEFNVGDEGSKPATIEIINTLGQVIFSRDINEDTEIEYIDYATAGIPAGSMVVRVTDLDGQLVGQEKIVITR